MSTSDETARIDALEMRFADQDRTLSDLNDVITAQWRKIDALEREIARLKDEFQNMAMKLPEAPEPPPPHY